LWLGQRPALAGSLRLRPPPAEPIGETTSRSVNSSAAWAGQAQGAARPMYGRVRTRGSRQNPAPYPAVRLLFAIFATFQTHSAELMPVPRLTNRASCLPAPLAAAWKAGRSTPATPCFFFCDCR
jgi:hypothetical protein